MGDFQLLKDMGFPEEKIKKALAATKHSGLQPALDWLEKHQNDSEEVGNENSTAEDETFVTENSEENSTFNSLKCDECAKMLRTAESAQMHAARTGHTNFSQSTDEIKPLSEEEKKRKLEELKAKLAEKRALQVELDKKEQKEAERIRRLAGKDMTKAVEQQKEKEILQAIEQKKKEKVEERLARERIKLQIEADKKARAEKAAEEKRIRDGIPLPIEEKPAMMVSEIKRNYDETRIQIRVQGKPPILHVFNTKDKFSALVELLNSQGISGNLSTTYPKKIFGSQDYEKSFAELNLVPSASLMLQ